MLFKILGIQIKIPSFDPTTHKNIPYVNKNILVRLLRILSKKGEIYLSMNVIAIFLTKHTPLAILKIWQVLLILPST